MTTVDLFKLEGFEIKPYSYKFILSEKAINSGLKPILYGDEIDSIKDILSYRGLGTELQYETVTLTNDQKERLAKLNGANIIHSNDDLKRNMMDITTFIMFGYVYNDCQLENLKELSYGYQAAALEYMMCQYDCLLKTMRKTKLEQTIMYRNRELTPDNATLTSLMSLLNMIQMDGTPNVIDYRFEDSVIISNVTSDMLVEMIKLVGNRIQVVRTTEYKTKQELTTYKLSELVNDFDVYGKIISTDRVEKLFEAFYTDTLKNI